MKIRDDICYQLNHTLLGKKFIVGIKKKNSFVKFDSAYIVGVKNFIDKYKKEDIKVEELETADKKIYDGLNKLGYLDNDIQPKGSFNEFKKIGKVFFEIKPKAKNEKAIGNNKIGIALVLFTILFMIIFSLKYKAYLPQKIDYIHMKLCEIIFSILVFPPTLLALHELGHCIMAKYAGVRVVSISFGWFYIYPIVLVQYLGLNLESQRQKLMVMTGGVYMNLCMLFVGLWLKMLWPDIFNGVIIDIWITANISTVITNLGLFGMTDGYFIFTMLVGAMDIRMKGYKYLNYKLNKNCSCLNNSYKVCGVILVGLYLNGIINLYVQLSYMVSAFDISREIVPVILTVLLLVLTTKFILRVKKAF